MKKLVALFLVVVMALSTVAIAGAESKPITWSGTISVASYMFGPYDEAQDVCVKWTEDMLRERYGLDVTFDVTYIEQANYREIINTRISGNAAPDIFISGGDALTRQYLDQGAIRSWDPELFKTNAPDVYEYIINGGYQGRLADAVDLWWEYAMEGDQMMTIPKLDEQNAMPSKSIIYRKDWLDKLGVTEDQLPKSLDDFVALLYRFKNEDPDGNGVDDTYGCSTSIVRAIFGAFGSSYETQLWLDKDGKLVSTDVLENNKAALEVCAKLYADGVLAPTFVAGENEGGYWAIPHGFLNGVYGVTCHASIDHFRRKGVTGEADLGGPVMTEYYAVNGPDADVVYGPWPMGPDGEYGLDVGSAANTGENYIYNANIDDEKLAVIFQLMNIFATDDEIYMRNAYGVEGVHYELTAENTVNVLDYVSTVNADTKNGIGLWVLRGVWGPEKAYSDTSNWYSFYGDLSIKNRLDNFDREQMSMYRHNILTATLPSQSDIYVDLETLRKEAFVDIITGVQPNEYYDEYVEEYMALGGQTLSDEANEWYAK